MYKLYIINNMNLFIIQHKSHNDNSLSATQMIETKKRIGPEHDLLI